MEPILLDIPESFEIERLALRVPRPGDGALMTVSLRESIDELKRWMPWAKDDYSVDDGEVWCRRVHGEFFLRRSVQYLLYEPDGGHVGNLGAFKFDWDVRSCEIGYWLRTDRVGRGYMAEALDGLCEMLAGVPRLRRVELRCDARNARSEAVARRSGFAHEGTLRGDAIGADNSRRDTHIFARQFADDGGNAD